MKTRGFVALCTTLVIALFVVGVKKGQQMSSDISASHTFQLQARILAAQSLNIVVRQLPPEAEGPLPPASSGSTGIGAYSYTVRRIGNPVNQLLVTTTGTVQTQKVTLASVVEELPSGSSAQGWSRWKQISSVRTISTSP